MVFCKQFDGNEHFSPFKLSQLQLRSASESIQAVQIIWADLNSNSVRLIKDQRLRAGVFGELVFRLWGGRKLKTPALEARVPCDLASFRA